MASGPTLFKKRNKRKTRPGGGGAASPSGSPAGGPSPKEELTLTFAFCIKYVGSEVVALSFTFAFFIHSLMLP